MAKAAKKTPAKKRAEHYEPKVSFGGTFEQMIGISLTGAGAPKKKEIKQDKIMIKYSVELEIIADNMPVTETLTVEVSEDNIDLASAKVQEYMDKKYPDSPYQASYKRLNKK